MEMVDFFSFKHFLRAEETYYCLLGKKSLDQDPADFVIESLLFDGEDGAGRVAKIGDIFQGKHACLVSEMVFEVELIGVKLLCSIAVVI